MTKLNIKWDTLIPLRDHSTKLALRWLPATAAILPPKVLIGEVGLRGGTHWYLYLNLDEARTLAAELTAAAEKAANA